ncbi:translation initiation factor IF-2 [Cytophagaceae bacterium ABcell3]|nr:translation initiation factor IF-2 [Cytophagaceae bacterium ABcell3]
MAEEKLMRLSQVARKLNVGTSTIADHLSAKGHPIENNPNSKITMEQYGMLMKEFESSVLDKKEASGLTIGKKHNENVVIESEKAPEKPTKEDDEEILIKNLSPAAPDEASESSAEQEKEDTPVSKVKLQGIKVVGKIDLEQKKGKAQQEEKAEEKPKEPEAPKKPEAPKEEKKAEPQKPKANVQDKLQEKKAEEKKPEEPKVEKKPTPVEEKPAAKTPEPPKAKEEKQEPRKEEKVPAKEKAKAEEKSKTEDKPKVEEPKAEEEKQVSDKKEKQPAKELKEKEEVQEQEDDRPDTVIEAKADQLKGLTVVGKIQLPEKKKKSKPVASSDDKSTAAEKKNKRKRKRVRINTGQGQGGGGQAPGQQREKKGRHKPAPPQKEEISDKDIQDKIKATLAKLSGNKPGGGGGGRSRYRREKRSAAAEAQEERMLQEQEDAKTLKVNEFISANDLASLMGVNVNDIISACLSLGMFISINQRLDAEAITVIADEFGYSVDFASAEEEGLESIEEEDDPKDLTERAPIVTIMGHVDHGKTSLLDYIRKAKVAQGEAGGITQHIGAYKVTSESGKPITFLDTPGHEAFTAMRARGAKITDIVIIVVAADDNVMPQTKEAINHAQVAGVPIVIAINKVDKPGANPDKIKEELAQLNILVEDWGGKYQCEEISAKTGQGISSLLEKVLLESEIMELKANPKKKAVGTIVEASLDKGRGYLATIMVQAGTLKIGDVMLAGAHYGKVKAMTDHRGARIKEAGPSTPVQVLGLNGAPQAGDKMTITDSDKEAREIATKREQLLREQSIRTKKHITLDEIGRRLAIGTFKELNVIVKGDVDGSIEALSDALLKLSNEEVQVNIIHKAVGAISESDILLASASDAIIVGFQVRPAKNAKRLAEQEQIEIRLYSIIYDAINDVKDAIEGMLAPKEVEEILGSAEVREVFKISKVGTVAGCYVTEGYIKRNSSIRLIRDGIVIHTGNIDALKRFKDDVNEVKTSYECGISLKGYNDLQEGDTIEAFEIKEVKRSLK